MARAKILVAATLDGKGTANHRALAIRRLGYDVVPFNFSDYLSGLGKVTNWAYHRLMRGPLVSRINGDLRQLAQSTRPNLILIDKGIFVTAGTVRFLSKHIAPTIQHNLDNPFGTMGEKSWRRLIDAIPYYDVHFVPRDINLADYKAAGAKRVIRVPLAFEPTVHFPPPPSWSDSDRTIDVSFTGSPYDDRAKFMTSLLTDHGISVDIQGDRWQKALGVDFARKLYTGPGVYGDAYRQRFWQSKLCLSFITRSNCDQVAHKSFEIAASGGVLLAEDTAEHRSIFEDGKEALFFTDLADCARLIGEYLPKVRARAAIARAAVQRSVQSGYSNDDRLRPALDEVRSLFSVD